MSAKPLSVVTCWRNRVILGGSFVQALLVLAALVFHMSDGKTWVNIASIAVLAVLSGCGLVQVLRSFQMRIYPDRLVVRHALHSQSFDLLDIDEGFSRRVFDGLRRRVALGIRMVDGTERIFNDFTERITEEGDIVFDAVYDLNALVRAAKSRAASATP